MKSRKIKDVKEQGKDMTVIYLEILLAFTIFTLEISVGNALENIWKTRERDRKSNPEII